MCRHSAVLISKGNMTSKCQPTSKKDCLVVTKVKNERTDSMSRFGTCRTKYNCSAIRLKWWNECLSWVTWSLPNCSQSSLRACWKICSGLERHNCTLWAWMASALVKTRYFCMAWLHHVGKTASRHKEVLGSVRIRGLWGKRKHDQNRQRFSFQYNQNPSGKNRAEADFAKSQSVLQWRSKCWTYACFFNHGFT